MTPELRKAIVDVNAAAKGFGIKAVLVGALTMEFTDEIGPGYPPPKRTNDADFAVLVEDWTAYGRLRDELKEKDYSPLPKVEHRFTNKAGTVLIDLVPVGEPIAQGEQVTWPESELVMNVVGFQEVCAAATMSAKPGLPRIPIITVPGFVLLKTIAYLDRSERHDPKCRNDVEHLTYWLENYASITEKDQRRFDFLDRTGWRDMDVNFAGAALLGQEVRRLSSPSAEGRIRKFLKDSVPAESPFITTLASLKGPSTEQEVLNRVRDEAVDWLRAFRRGFESR